MHCLYIDLASHLGLLACVDDRSVVAFRAIDHRIGDHELVPIFEQTLQEVKWVSGDLTHIACVIGPGGFMSLRVASAFANTLMRQLKIPVAGVHLSEVCAARVRHASPRTAQSTTPFQGEREQGEPSFLWLHSTKKHELFVRGFGAYAKVWPEATHLMLENFSAKAPAGAMWAGELIPDHEALVREKGMSPVALTPLEEVLPTFLGKQKYEHKLLEPWYGREG